MYPIANFPYRSNYILKKLFKVFKLLTFEKSYINNQLCLDQIKSSVTVINHRSVELNYTHSAIMIPEFHLLAKFFRPGHSPLVKCFLFVHLWLSLPADSNFLQFWL